MGDKEVSNLLLNFSGVNKSMYSWIIESPLIGKIFSNIDSKKMKEHFAQFFGSYEEKRELAAIDLYKIIWEKFAELGPLPVVELLQNFEHDRIFYKNYRDHTMHMLRTFLLGIYFYEGNSIIKENIDEYLSRYKMEEHSKEDIFIFTWILTALYHDIGYIIENDKIEGELNLKREITESINKVLLYPLSHTAKFSAQISEEKEGHIINSNEIFVKRFNGIGSIATDRYFSMLENGSQRSGLTKEGINGIKNYYSLACEFKPQNGRDSFRDHGISSALLLLFVWTSYRDYVSKICEKECCSAYGTISNTVIQLNNTLDSFRDLVIIAANSIALHNIDKDIWESSEALNKQLDFESFYIQLTNDKENMPLAFLLRLCDEIQVWDRPRFRAPMKGDKMIYSQDMNVTISKKHVFIEFKGDTEKYVHPDNDEDGNFKKLKNSLTKYLQVDIIDDLLKYGVASNVKNTKIENKFAGTTDTDVKNQKSAEKLLENDEWLVGAVNLDEDIHFSSYYLLQSLAANLPKEYQEYGYKNIVAVYDDFNETYYIPQRECITVSQNLTNMMIKDISFWDNIIKKIVEYINELRNVFINVDVSSFSSMDMRELTNIYKKHNEVHKMLYLYARIPEVLDRGIPTFTNYLKNYLKSKSAELQNDEKLNEVFEILTYPENLSYSGQEIVELYDLICQIRAHDERLSTKTFTENSSRLLINMDSEIKEAIQKYSNKWAFWGYHGYRNRAIRDFNYFVEKLRVDFKNKRIEEYSKRLLYELEHNPYSKLVHFSEYDVDIEHKALFKAFSKIGTIKIYRRYVQLINFYYLDKLISEIACRFNTTERVIRCMLPEEVERALEGDTSYLAKGIERSKSSIFAVVFKDKRVNFVCGDEAKRLYENMKKKTQQILIDKGKLQGDPVSKGRIKGIARVISAGGNCNFERGDILVCTDTDPDLFDYIKIAGAVLAESGGLTCHSAIVCRELQIPCIVRVAGLLENIHDGDILDIDANIGEISIATSISNYIIKSISCNKEMWETGDIGRKAAALIRMKSRGIKVPEFICIPIALLLNMFNELEADGKGNESQALITEIKTAVRELDAPFFAIRSSTSREDREDFSGAGQEVTRLHVLEDDIIYTLEQMINEMKITSDEVSGSIIIQRMVFGEISGVLFTKHPLQVENIDHQMIVEAVRGGNDHLTSGQISPTRYSIVNGRNEMVKRGDKWGGQCSDLQLQLLEKAGKTIENIFNSPQDIEWTIAENELYILQSRNITGNVRIDRAFISRHCKRKSQMCVCIYQNYALPLVLQMHMLRVAAVAKWIIDHWDNSEVKINEQEILETLLLHDIGNIVKGEDKNFAQLFPDTYPMESFKYWVHNRNWVKEHYGEVDTEATKNILKEIGVSERILEMIEKKQFVNNEKTFKETDFAIKICAYADQRVSPEGIMSLGGRLNEAIKRYQGVKGVSVNSPNRKELIDYAMKIEEQIFEYVDGTPDMITDQSIQKYILNLKRYEFKNLQTNK